MTIQDVVWLAEQRELPGTLEYLWEARTGVNPVRAALKITRIDDKISNWWYLLLLTAPLAISAIWMRNSISGQSIVLLSTFCVLYFVGSLMGLMFSYLPKIVLLSSVEKQQAREFASDVVCLREWSKIVGISNLYPPDRDLKAVAKLILAERASFVHQLQEEARDEKDLAEKSKKIAAGSERMNQFKARHNVLNRLQLVTAEWQGYFDEGKAYLTKRREEEAARIARMPSPEQVLGLPCEP